MFRCEFEALPEDAETEMEAMYDSVLSNPLQGVQWRGFRSEPMCFGLCKMIATATVDTDENGDAADHVLEMLLDLAEVQSATLLSMQQFHGDPFDICSGLFRLDRSGLGGLELSAGRVDTFSHLMEHGYAVLDDFVDRKATDGVVTLVRESLGSYPEFKEDGIVWKHPSPRNARGDLTTWLAAGTRPAIDPIFEEVIMPSFKALQTDLAKVLRMRGSSEQQLAWYPGDGAGYKRHTDAMPDDDGESEQRKVTAILYCNAAWEPEHGGVLKLWLSDKDGGETCVNLNPKLSVLCSVSVLAIGLDLTNILIAAGGVVEVEPVAGRVLLFLSGCMLHEVAPSHRDRYAITNWFA